MNKGAVPTLRSFKDPSFYFTIESRNLDRGHREEAKARGP